MCFSEALNLATGAKWRASTVPSLSPTKLSSNPQGITCKLMLLMIFGMLCKSEQISSTSRACQPYALMATFSNIVVVVLPWIVPIGVYLEFRTHGTSCSMLRYLWSSQEQAVYTSFTSSSVIFILSKLLIDHEKFLFFGCETLTATNCIYQWWSTNPDANSSWEYHPICLLSTVIIK